MAQFTLQWDNSEVLDNDNAIAQRASYRYRAVGGTFLTTGFSPVNDLDKSAITTDSPVLSDNRVVQFKVETLCTVGGASMNDNGIQEAINFVCPTSPTIITSYNSAITTFNLPITDIVKANLTLRKASDNSIVTYNAHPVKNIPVYKDGIDHIYLDLSNVQVSEGVFVDIILDSSTNYYWQVELFATVNNVSVSSVGSEYLGGLCQPYPFTTDAAPVCSPITAGTISSIEVS